MITESMMYWITRLDGIGVLASVALFVCIVAAVIYGCVIGGCAFSDDNIEEIWQTKLATSARRWILWVAGLSVATLVFLPSSKEMAMIYAVPAITRSDVVREDLPELYDYGVKALKQQLIEWSEPRETRRA